MSRLDFHVISIFCLHCALYKSHTWKVFVYGNIFSFVKATGTGGAPRWRPDFDLRSRHQTRIFLKWCENEVSFSLWKYQPCYKDINNCLESQFWKLYVDSLSCSSVHFAVFPFLPRVFSLPLTILLICLSSSSTLHSAIEISKKGNVSAMDYVSRLILIIVIDTRRFRCPIGLRFQEAR